MGAWTDRITVRNLYLHRFWNDLGDGLLKVFVPVLIYKNTGSLIYVSGFLLFYYVLQSGMNLALFRRICQYPILALLLRLIPVLGTQFLLTSSWNDWRLMLGLAITTASANVFYWIPLHYTFLISAKSKVGSSIGQLQVAAVAGKFVAPLISGFLLSAYGIELVASIAILLYILSVICMYYPRFPRQEEIGQPAQRNPPLKPEKQLESKAVSGKMPLSAFLRAYILAGTWDTAEVFWTIYVFRTSVGLLDVGIVASLIQLGVVLSNLIIGRLSDQHRWWLPAVAALGLYGLFWTGRALTDTPVWIYVLSAGSGILRPMFEIPMFSGFIINAKHSKDFPRWIVMREVAIKSGGIGLVLVASLVPSLLQFPFICAAITSLLFLEPLSRVSNNKS